MPSLPDIASLPSAAANLIAPLHDSLRAYAAEQNTSQFTATIVASSASVKRPDRVRALLKRRKVGGSARDAESDDSDATVGEGAGRAPLRTAADADEVKSPSGKASVDYHVTSEEASSPIRRLRLPSYVPSPSHSQVDLPSHLKDPPRPIRYHKPLFGPGENTTTTHFYDVPPWMQDNYYILSGYRRPTHSIPSSLSTIFHLHNESGNIWSHLLASLAFLLVLTPVTYFSILPSILGTRDVRLPGAGITEDEVMMAPFLVGAIGCLGLSATFHTLCCTSQEVAHAYNKLDYAGIILLIVGSFAPTLHYAFYCSPITAHVYMGVQAVLGAIALYFTIAPRFATPHFRTFRATLFSALGLAGVVPVVHVLSLYGVEYALKGGSMAYLITMAVMYLSGAVLYAVRWPECWWPGRFDFWFHSHQIFHLLVVSAAVTHWLGAISAARWWHGGAIMGDGNVWEGFQACAR